MRRPAKRRAKRVPGQLLALPSDVWGCIACATLAAEGSTVQARGRLSLVCRTWRDALRSAQSRNLVALVDLVSFDKRPSHGVTAFP